ncbi:MAG: SUMF1/EgtB/PvdO family nonheme iron enzyme [Candidatus Wallbacteria bacterium]|nr:SUMF1/EgtB/PvdO family nonheme iron enzyme [Candidatus Wallbacteria bacterium]
MSGSRQSKSLKSGEAGLESLAAETVLPPGLLATYRPEEFLGAGAMGVVWRATHLALDRPVAIKLATSLERELVTRFIREGRLLARLEHPNLVRVHDAGEIDGCPYLVMELVRGVTLSALAGGRALAAETVAALGVQLLEGLGHAHAAGVLHRDVKSDNVLVTPEGVLKLADFGLAKSQLEATRTQAGMIMGTPAYMSPEQARGMTVDGRSDLYSAAVVLFELAAGRLPFTARNPMDVLVMQLQQPPPELSRLAPGLPASVAAAVMKGLAKDPAERFATAGEFASCLRLAFAAASAEQSAAHVATCVRRLAPATRTVAGTTSLGRELAGDVARRTVRAEPEAVEAPSSRSRAARPAAPVGANRMPATLGRRRSALAIAALVGLALVSWSVGRPWLRSVRSASPASSDGLAPVASPGEPLSGIDRPTRNGIEGSGRRSATRLPITTVSTLLPESLERVGENGAGYVEYRNSKDGMVLISVPGGEFEMGSDGGGPGESPLHRVTLAPYLIGKLETSWEQYLEFCSQTGHVAPPQKPQPGHPVSSVTWFDAQAYCRWAGLRLPTEAQWEYAARGRDGREYPWGNEEPGAGGVYRANLAEAPDGFAATSPVGSFGPDAKPPQADGSSPFGALDMAGNLWEWCHDWKASYAAGPQVEPRGPEDGTQRVLRGGCMNYFAPSLRSAGRIGAAPGLQSGNCGFRCAR